MSAHALLAEIRHAGIIVEARGERLHVEAKPGTLTDELRARLTANKADLLDALHAQTHPLPSGERLTAIGRMRGELQRLARLEGIDLAHVHRLDDADVLACRGESADTLAAYLRALVASAAMDAGLIPQGWRGAQAAICDGCGPVLLWPGAPDRLKACPWCFRHKAGKAIPRPEGQH